ncbi:hypothetical protein RHSIM_Rhsim11G0106900 [Rhododendron simsii]|uniref:Uncharacterized protein n=1 Tax=Rhododendron simsii TaxID=118357 RepID=A0A834G6C4_RHOSS|nr:hypothetical protein RHSIM_Rhsim11G0106900 [Rhododendron simsii]
MQKKFDSGTFPESGVTIDDVDMIEGLGGSLADDDSDSDANYDYFHDSDYDLSDENDGIYDENVDANSEWVGSRNASAVSPAAPRKRIVEASDFFMQAPIDEGDDSLCESDDAEYEDSEDGFLSGSDGEDIGKDKTLLGLEHAIKELLPEIEHRHCVKHLHNNFKNAGYGGQVLHDKLWNLARASYVGKFNLFMGELEKEDPGAFKWLSDPDRNPCHWSRDKPILNVLEKLRTFFMKRLVDKRAFPTKWVDELGPKIHDKIEKIKSRYGDYIVILCGEHAVRVIVESGGQPVEYVSK